MWKDIREGIDLNKKLKIIEELYIRENIDV